MATKTEGIRIILKDKETDKPLGGIPVNIKVSANNFEKTKKTDNKWGEATFETKEGFDTGETITIIVNPGAYFGYEEVRPGSSAALPGLVIIRRYSLAPKGEEEEEPEEDKRVKARIKRLKRTHSKRRPGEEQTITFGLQNRGSKSHKFHISAAISSPQQAVHTSDKEFVRQDYTDQVSMPVKIPPDMPAGRKTITVSVFEDKEKKIEKDTKTTTFTVQGEPTTAPKTFCEYINKAYKKVTLIYMQMAVGDWMAGKITTSLRDKAVTGFQNSTVFEECTAEKWAIITELKVEKAEVAPGERPLIRFTVKNTGKQKTDILFRWGLETPSTSWRIEDVVPNTHRGGTFQPPAKTQEGEYRIKCETKIDGTKTHEASVSYEVKEEKADIGAEIKDVSFPSGTDFISPGRAVAYATVTNIGAKDHTFALGMSLINGQTIDGTWRKVELFAEEEGKEKIVTLGIVIPPNVPQGSYTIRTSIWKGWEGGKENEEEDGFDGGRLIDRLDSDNKSATIKASDVPEPPEPERPTTEPQMSWWDKIKEALQRVPDDIGRLVDGTISFIGKGTLEAGASFVCTLASQSSPGSLSHRKCMASFPMNMFLEDYWIIAYGRKPDGTSTEPSNWNRAFVALIFVPGSWVSKPASLGGRWLFTSLRGFSVPTKSLLGPGLSKIWKALPVIGQAESQAVKTAIEKGNVGAAAKILDDAGQLVTPTEWWEILKRNPTVMNGQNAWAIKYVDDLAEESIDFATTHYKLIGPDDIARSKAVWGEWYTQMLKVLDPPRTRTLMRELGIGMELIKVQIGSVAYKTGITQWSQVLKRAKATGMSDKQITQAWYALGRPQVTNAILKGEIAGAAGAKGIKGAWKATWAWAKKNPIAATLLLVMGSDRMVMVAWWVVDNLVMLVFGGRQAGTVEKTWGVQWKATQDLIDFTVGPNLKRDPCNKANQEAYITQLAELYRLLVYAADNPPSEDALTKFADDTKLTYGMSIGNPLEIIAMSNRLSFEAHITTYLQYVHWTHAFPEGSKEPCKDWVPFPDEWEITVADHITDTDEEGEPKPDVPDEFSAMVREVLDGDTVRIKFPSTDNPDILIEDRVRLVGINSPETAKSKKQKDGSYINYPSEPFAKESKVWLARKIGNRTVIIRVDPAIPRDSTDTKRILGAIYLQDEYINLQSVVEGWSSYYPLSPNKHVDDTEFREAQAAAIEAKLGMWSGGYAELNVTSTPGRGQISIGGEDKENQTTHTFDLPPGTYEITVKLEGYLDLTKSITLEPDDEKSLHFPLSEVTDTAEIYIASVPSGARIFMEGKETDLLTPETLKIKKKDLGDNDSGNISLKLKRDEYKDWERSIFIKLGDSKRLEITLESEKENVGQVKVTTSPANAAIYVDGKNTGTLTPHTIELQCDEEHEVAVKAKGFAEFTFDSIWVPCSKLKELYHKFEKKVTTGKLRVVSTPTYATIEIDGEDNGFTPKTFDVLEGTWTVTLKKRGYMDYTFRNVVIEKGHQKDIYAEMSKEEETTGTLSIISAPSLAGILIKDSEGIEKTVGYTPQTVDKLKPGTYMITLSKKGYADTSSSATVRRGETTEVFIDIEKIETNSGLNIRSSPTNAKVFINGEDTGYITPKKIDLEEGQHNLKVELDKFRPFTARPIIVKNKYKDIFAKLEPFEEEIGTVKISSSPSTSYIKVNGQDIFRVTSSTIKLDPGSYIVSVSKRNYQEQERDIIVLKGKHLDVHFDLSKKEEEKDQGELSIRSSPSNAIIKIAGDTIGKLTPETIDLDPGTYEVEVEKDGYESKSTTVEIIIGELTEVFLQLDGTEGAEEEEKRKKEEEEEAAKVHGVPEGWPWTLSGTGESQSEAGGMSSLFKGGEEEEDEDDTKNP